MTVRSILSLIWNGKTERLRREFVAASRVRDEACKRLCACRLVGDTRSIHQADAEYRAATHTALRAEIAWRAVRKPVRQDRSSVRHEQRPLVGKVGR